ncbi:MAG: tRNA-dihydrouridine synthase family protein [Acidobacteriota bacterium]
MNSDSTGITPAALRLCLAPMAGLTGAAFRRLIRRLGGCGVVFTEFVSAEGLTRGSRKSLGLLEFSSEEHPISCQVFGSNAAAMAESARVVESLGADGVDINAGCPVPKVVKRNAGAALLDDPRRCREIITSVVKSTALPVSVKMRAGLKDEYACMEVGRIAEDCGISFVTIHARTAAQGYGGVANWDIIARLKAHLRIPVVGNGDVRTAAQAVEMVERTRADGVMIGRGAVANPAIFAEAAGLIAGTPAHPPPRRAIFESYMELLGQGDDPFDALNHLKQFVSYFTRGMRGGGEFRNAVNRAKALGDVERVAREYAFDAAPVGD